MKRVGFILAATFCVMLMSTSAWAATYYSQGSVTPNTLTNWNTNRLGGGTSPATFTTAGDIFVVQGTGNGGTSPHSMTTTATLSFGAAGSKLQIESGGTLTAANAITIASGATFQIDNGGNYIHNNTGTVSTTIFNGTESFGITSNFEIRIWGGTANSSTTSLNTSLTASVVSGGNNYFYGNLTINTTSYTGIFSTGLSGTVRECAGNLTFTSTGTSTTGFRFSTTSATVFVLGDYSQASGTNVDFSSGTSATMNLGGNFSLAGTAKLDNLGTGFAAIGFVKSSGTQTVNVSSTANQTWMLWTVGDGTTTNTVQLLNSINATTRRVGSITINANATLDLNGFTVRIEGSTTGNVVVTGTLTGTVANSKLLHSSATTGTTNLSGAGTINGSNLTIEYVHTGTGVQLISRDLTINTLIVTSGTVRLNATATLRTINLTNFSMAAGTLDTGSVDVTGNVTSVVNLTGIFSKTGGTVTNASPSGIGVFVFKGVAQTFANTGIFEFASIIVTNNTTLTLNTAMTFSGVTGPLLTIDLGSTVVAGTQLISTGSTSGNYVINGTLKTANTNGLNGTATTTFTSTNTPTVTLGASSTIEYNGAAAQTITARADYANMTLNNAAGGTLGGATTVGATLSLTSGALSIGANTLTLNGAIAQTGGSLSGGATSNIVFGGAGPSTTLPAVTLNNLTINRANGISLGGNVTVGGTLTLTSGALAIGANTLTLNGPLTATGGTLTGGSTSNLVVGGAGVPPNLTLPGAITLNNLTLNRANGLTLGGATTIDGGTNALTLTSGILNTGANTLTMGTNATSNGSSASYVVGTMKKLYEATPSSFTFDLGTIGGPTDGYTPAAVNAQTGSGDVTATVTNAYHPTLTGSSLRRYWSLTNNGITLANLVFNYLDGDLPTSPPEAALVTYKIDGMTAITPVGSAVNPLTNQITMTGATSFSDWTAGAIDAPTAVRSLTSDAASYKNGNLIRWQTGYEASNLGFVVYREQGGRRTRLTPSLVAGSALLAGSQTILTAGQSYTWFDQLPENPGFVQYWIEDVDLNGKRTMHGPISPGGKASARFDGARRSMMLSDIRPSTTVDAAAPQAEQGHPALLSADVAPAGIETGRRTATIRNTANDASDPLAQQRAIAAGQAVKIAVRQNGWYRIPVQQLAASGLNPNADHSLLQLYADGVEQPMLIISDDGTTLGGIEFYGTGLNQPGSDARTYWLVNGTQPGQRIAERAEGKGIRPPTIGGGGPQSYAYTVERRDRVVYVAALHNGDAENFFGPVVSQTAATQTLNVKSLDPNTGNIAKLEVSLQGVTEKPHQVRVALNGNDVGTLDFDNQAHPAKSFTISPAALIEGQNTVTLTALNGDTDVSVVDFVRVTYARKYVAENDALTFSNTGSAAVTINGFTTSDVRVFDIGDPNNVQSVAVSVRRQGPTYSVTVPGISGSRNPAGGRAGRALIALADSQALQAAAITANESSSLTGSGNSADFVIITHGAFKTAVEPLAQLRRSQGMQVSVVDVEDIYDEFSYGAHDTLAVKEFLAWTQGNWQHAPHYALFVGDASLDPRNYLGYGNQDYVPTRIVDTRYLETASDDALADFDNDGLPDLAVGRLPARTAAQAATLVSKIVNYVPGQMAQGALLVSDHNEGYDFEGVNSNVQSLLPAGMPVQTINRGTNDAGTVRTQIINGLNQGPMVVNYAGHGSVEVWTGAGILSSSDVGGLTNGNHLPLVVTMTCLNGFFQDVYTESLAEALMKAENGGAVAVWSSSGLTEPAPQAAMNQELIRLLFGEGETPTLGDAVKAAKQSSSDMDVRRTWILFGDPTMRLR